MNIFVFDIETIPDIAAGRNLHQFSDLSDIEVAEAMTSLRRQESDSSFLRHHHQRICAISVVFRYQDSVKVWSLGEPDSSEAELIERFYNGIEKYSPTLVSWNGGGFDLPVLHYRSLVHGISAPRYWDTGNNDSNFKWNNYLSRYHNRHLDLMDVLSGYQPRAVAPLDEIAMMCGFPGKMGMNGSKVWEAYCNGQINEIRNYCETDVLNTFLVYLRFELIRGNLTPDLYQQECQLLRTTLTQENKSHLNEFLAKWPTNENVREKQ